MSRAPRYMIPVTPGLLALKRRRARSLTGFCWALTAASASLLTTGYALSETYLSGIAYWFHDYGFVALLVHGALLLLCSGLTLYAVNLHRHTARRLEHVDASSVVMHAERLQELWERDHALLEPMHGASRRLKIVQYALTLTSIGWLPMCVPYVLYHVRIAHTNPSEMVLFGVGFLGGALFFITAVSWLWRLVYMAMMRRRERSCHALGVVRQELIEGAPEGALSIAFAERAGALSLGHGEEE